MPASAQNVERNCKLNLNTILMNCPNPQCNTKNLPEEAKFCPNCGTKILPPVMNVKSCKVTPKSVTLGDDCKIQWQGDFVQHVVIDGVKYTQKSIALQPKHSQTLAVTFVGLDESTLTKEVNISVVVPQPDIEITAPEYANNGDKIEIKWNAKYVDKVTIGDKSFKSKDKVSLVHENDKTICEILFYGIDGSVVPKIIKVRKALPANIESCAIVPEYLDEKEPITVTWKGSNVVKWEINKEHAFPEEASRIIPSTNNDIKITFYGEDRTTIEQILTPKICKVNFCTLEEYTITDKESVKIKWSAQNIKSVTIFGESQAEIGSYIWKPKNIGTEKCSVEFVRMNGRTETRVLKVNVVPEPKITQFELIGDNLVWKSVSMDGCSINGSRMLDTQGTFKISNKMIEDGKVVLDCWDWRKKHYTKELSPSIISFCANEQKLYKGQNATLSWSTFGMTKVIVNRLVQKNKGAITMPITTTQVNLDCWDKDNKYYSQTLKFELSEPQILNFSASSTRVLMGDTVTIAWETKGMKRIRLQDTEYYDRGTITLPITSPSLLLECWGYDDRYYTQTINFDILPDPELCLYADEVNIYQGKSTTIRWTCKNVQNVKLNNEEVPIKGHKTMTFDKVGRRRITLSAEDLTGKKVKSKIANVTVKENQRLMGFILSLIGSAIMVLILYFS